MQLGADRRLQAVRPDERVGLESQADFVRATGKQYLDGAVAFREAGHLRPRHDRFFAEPLADRGQQDHLEFAAVDGVLRP